MSRLVLLRHGESEFNRADRFAGWIDVELSEWGCEEAKRAGALIRKEEIRFNVAFTSVLRRAIRTLWITLDALDLAWLPIEATWRLNERHYGGLQGMNRATTARRYGAEQVRLWRRSFDVSPPRPLPGQDRTELRDPRYLGQPVAHPILGESFKDVLHRVLPFWQEVLEPRLQTGSRVLVVAHGSSLRALVKYVEHLPGQDAARMEVPTGGPLIYHLDGELKPLERRYLAEPWTIDAAPL